MKEYISGDKLFLWGKPYTLRLSEGGNYKVNMTEDEIILGVGENDSYNMRVKALNLHLAKMPLVWLEAVIIHELVHIRIPCHSQRFYDMCGKVFPDYVKMDAQLNILYVGVITLKHSDKTLNDKVRGSMIGGAAGDALGYAVEFMRLGEIKRLYGDEGITEYELEPHFLHQSGKGFISDDTQMSLFTANGILMYDANEHKKPVMLYVYLAYLDWLKTQTGGHEDEKHYTWLYEQPDLHHRRAPGMTCMSSLSSGNIGSVRDPINDSKGCGGVMRAAPVGLRYVPENDDDIRKLDIEGAEIAAITHGHSLGWLPAALLTHIIARVMQSYSLKEAIHEAWSMNKSIFRSKISETHLDEMNYLIELALKLSESKHNDERNIREIGQGWTGDEALAVALYCALRYSDDFSRALIASVNHDGDSDSTGAVAGNIIGAMLGYDAIADKWKEKLELRDLILEVSDDLCSDTWPEGRYLR